MTEGHANEGLRITGFTRSNSCHRLWRDLVGRCALKMATTPIMEREPSQLIGLVIGIAVGVGTFLTQIIADVGPDATWKKIAISAGLLLIQGGQGKITREFVYSPATFKQTAFALKERDAGTDTTP
jgi:hypothetical protein